MAGPTTTLTVTTQILGQVAGPTTTYCYLYEPLKISIREADGLLNTKIYIELVVRDTSDQSTIIEEIPAYGEYDINPAEPLTVDLMKIARQHHDANVYKFSNISEIANDDWGWKAVVSEYVYEFKVTSDVSTNVVTVKKLPIIGGRDFTDFTPSVSSSQELDEGSRTGWNLAFWYNRNKGYKFLQTALVNPLNNDARPSVSTFTGIKGYAPCGGYLVWKSKFGGWMQWGFDISSETTSRKYIGNLQVGLFESTADELGSIYVPADYTGITTTKSRKLKSINLDSEMLKAVSGIMESPAVYYMDSSNGDLELMRLASASVPVENLSNGGNFTVNLRSVSSTNQKTR